MLMFIPGDHHTLLLMLFFQDLVAEVQHALYSTLSDFDGNVEEEE